MFKKFRSLRPSKTDQQSHSSDHHVSSEPLDHTATSLRSPLNERATLSPSTHETSGRLSQLSPGSSDRLHLNRSPSPDSRLADSLGLKVIFTPGSPAPLDIIFVHGLGGASCKTWSKFRDPGLFWPQQWLPLEPQICSTRILSFGYNADFRSGSPRNISNIADFAKELLFEMKFGQDDNTEEFGIGKVPIIFVAHSMGGLVVKKAYILGQNDENYHDIVQSISAIVFLATPHRGTNLAETLNRVLSASFQAPKNFIVDLNRSSPALEDLNEQFRHIAPKLSIVSFYETLRTSIGPKKLMILEKDSSILGYPGEVSKALNADHHDVCKFTSQDDSNYISVRNALNSLVGRFKSKGADLLNNRLSEDFKQVGKLFSVSQIPEDDFDFFRKRWMPGSCEWIKSEPVYETWLGNSPESRVAWLCASPASGKSVLSTHIINHVRERGLDCQYFFFRFGDQTKRSLSALLRSIGFQMAQTRPAYRQKLMKISNEGLILEKADARIIWQKIFVSVLFRMALDKPLYWVIDALDESDTPKALLDLLQDISKSRTPIRVLLVSRETEAISLAFDRLSVSTPVEVIRKAERYHTQTDIHLYVENELQYMRGGQLLQKQVTESIMQRADGNFLWVHLVIEEILLCHTESGIRKTLKDLPTGMAALYSRMELGIASNPRPSDWALARTLLKWTVCARRPLLLVELTRALAPDSHEFLDLESTIREVCGQFIVVDHKTRVTLVHQTARDYLTKTPDLQFSVNTGEAHALLFERTISELSDPDLRPKLRRLSGGTSDGFLIYAATSWPYHLRHSIPSSDATLDLLVKFFKGQFVLTWIHSLGVLNQLETLLTAGSALTSFLSLNRRLNANKNPLLHRLQDLELLELWATDLVRILGKFGRHLLQDPASIYQTIPSFCPKDSAIHRQFSGRERLKVTLSEISSGQWNDCLARISLRNGEQAWKIICAGHYFVVLSSTGTIYLWNSRNFEIECTLPHGEHVTAFCFSAKCDRIVSCGLNTTRLWAIPSGQLLSSIANPLDVKALAVTFTENDTEILSASDDKMIRRLRIKDAEKGWPAQGSNLIAEKSQIEGGFLNSPSVMAFNANATKIAVAYRGYPLSVWTTKDPQLISRCKRVFESRPGSARPSNSWMAVDRIAWNPTTSHLLGLYKDGSIFKWDPVTDENREVHTTADEVEISSDGKLFITSDGEGTIKVWNFAYLSVIYQLSSENLVTGLAFSPDCSRFYDLRWSSINVWEPNSLLRLLEAEDNSSETASEEIPPPSISHFSDAWVATVDPICALAAAPRSLLYCAANEDGAVNLFRKSAGKILEVARFLSFQTVDHLTWAEDGKHIAAADLGGNIMVKRLQCSNEEQVDVQSVLTAKADRDFGGIRQILLDWNSKKLLVAGEEYGHVWSVETGSILARGAFEMGRTRKWVNHPLQEGLLLGFGPTNVKAFRWDDLEEVASLVLESGCPQPPEELSRLSLDPNPDLAQPSLAHIALPRHETFVSRVLLTQDGRHLFIQISESSSQGRTTKRLRVVNTSSLRLSDAGDWSEPLSSLDIPEEISLRIEVPLEIMSGKIMVFLDNDLWMCTFRLDSLDHTNALTRHYFIPTDWASAESLDQCLMLEDGTFLFPKDGEIAEITSDLGNIDW